MDSFEFNKIAGAVLATALVVFGLKELSGRDLSQRNTGKAGLCHRGCRGRRHRRGPGGKRLRRFRSARLLASADAAKGAAGAKACAACHDFTKGGPNKTGPNLWDVVERGIAAHEGFAYSDGMKARSAEKWTYESARRLPQGPKDRHAQNENGLCRRQEGPGPGRHHRLSGLAFGCAEAISRPVIAAIVAKI